MSFSKWLVFALFIVCSASAQSLTSCADTTATLQFAVDRFQITSNLYLPATPQPCAAAVWVHGSGPDTRTNGFPGIAFFKKFLDNGIAVLRYDKPGCGDSKGTLSDSLFFQERAAIVSAAIDRLKQHPRIDANRVGMISNSQAGYVMPLVLSQRADVAFMVGLSLPAQTGHEQWAYLLKMQLIHAGYDNARAEEFAAMHLKLVHASSREEFDRAVQYFRDHPVNIPGMNGYDETFAESMQSWWPLDWTTTQSFDPMPLLQNIQIAMLIIYGEKDTQVDPRQGARAYRKALTSADNPCFEVVMLPATDHNMAIAETGSLYEQQHREKSKMSPCLVSVVQTWLARCHQFSNP